MMVTRYINFIMVWMLWDVLKRKKMDLAILDVSLPDGSGFDFCKKIRSTSKVPIMFLTAADEETDIIILL